MKKNLTFLLTFFFCISSFFAQELDFIYEYNVDSKTIKNHYENSSFRPLNWVIEDNYVYAILRNPQEEKYYFSKLNYDNLNDETIMSLDFLTDRSQLPYIGLHQPQIKKLSGKDIICIELFTYENVSDENNYFFYLFSLQTQMPILFATGTFFTYPQYDKFFYGWGPNLFEISITQNEEIITTPLKTNFKKYEKIIFFKPLNDFYVVLLQDAKHSSPAPRKPTENFTQLFWGYSYYICKNDKNIIKKQKHLKNLTSTSGITNLYTDVRIKIE